MSDRVWIRAHVEQMVETDEYLGIDRDVWEGWTERGQDDFLVQAALDAMNNAGGCGASVVDESEVPDEWKDQ